VMYASDMGDYESELSQLLDFVRPIGAELAVVHVAPVDGQNADGSFIEKAVHNNMGHKLTIFSREWDMSHAILKGIQEEALRYKPSLIAFFTHQSRSFLAKLLLSSNAAAMSFYSKVPLISYRK